MGGADGGAQMSLSSRHSSILGSSQEAEAGGYRALPSVSAHYGGQYSSIYGSTALSATQQVSGLWFHILFVCFDQLLYIFSSFCNYSISL